ncbi:MAG: glycosyl transferase family 1 [Planctomycetes bacterium]|jgi:glycosyltransferase involved in cell wall biosynthesis|nr:glycosyl transferase family 1 [Planctomycetota bacterium]MDP6409010.1 DUF3524 domain-containing protein [Planctomycetota bacterium]
MKVLALEPWYGGSHRKFLEQWRQRTRHELEVVGLPPRRWKWRMRSSAWELARKVAERALPRPDALFVSGYVDLPALFGELPPAWANLPSLLYLHENQLTYPSNPAHGEPKSETHFGYTNIQSCVRADRVVLNSTFQRLEFATAADDLLRALPRPNPRAELEASLRAAAVIAPGIDLDAIPTGPGAEPGAPLRVLFSHRWEHDKDPVAFLGAVEAAVDGGACLELVLLGERFTQSPAGMAAHLDALRERIRHSGFVEGADVYASLLGGCDLIVSSARHEFFGLAVTEAMAAGCSPLLPNRLSYPEILPASLHDEGLYGSSDELVRRLVAHAADAARLRSPARRARMREAVRPWSAGATASALDAACDGLTGPDGTHRRLEARKDGGGRTIPRGS